MKPFNLLLLAIILSNSTSAMTIEEYEAKTAEERIKILQRKPDKVLSDLTQLLKLYTLSLNDASPKVQKTAAQASVFLTLGLQSAKPKGKMPVFTKEDSAAFQQALARSLHHHDETVRAPSAIALAYSAPPNAEIESLLLERTRNEPSSEVKAAIVEAMAQAGYNSARLVSEAVALIQPNNVPKAIYAASKVLAHLRPESALDTLINLSSSVSQSQRHALQALAAYGSAAARARPMLEKLISDQAMPEDIRKFARLTLDAITEGHPQASNLQPLSVVELWPVAIGAPQNVTPQQSPVSAATPESLTPVQTATPGTSPAQPTLIAQIPVAPLDRRAPMWLRVVGILALLLIVSLSVIRRA